MGYPLEHPHKLCCLRQELVDAFVESRYMTFIKVAAYHLQKYGFKNQAVPENPSALQDAPIEPAELETSKEGKDEASAEEIIKQKVAAPEEDASATLTENITKPSEKEGMLGFKFNGQWIRIYACSIHVEYE